MKKDCSKNKKMVVFNQWFCECKNLKVIYHVTKPNKNCSLG